MTSADATVAAGSTARVIALDGHDGSGKSTISALVAEELGGKVARAFPGELGAMIGWLAENAAFEKANELAHLGVEKATADSVGNEVLIFDRHWLTMFTLLPEEYWPSWNPRPLTIICWTDAQTTKARLQRRGEETASLGDYEAAIARFISVGRAFGLPVIDTTNISPKTAAEQVLDFFAEIYT